MKKLLAVTSIAVIFTLASCSQPATNAKTSTAPLSYKQGLPIRLNAASVSVDDQYEDSHAAPQVEGKLDYTPADAIEDWADARLQAVGVTGRVVVVIQEASITADPLPKQSEIESLVTPARQQHYHARLNVIIRLYDGENPLAVAEASVNVTRGKSLKENATPEERAQFYADLTNDVMRSFDDQATKQIRQYFKAYIQ